MKPAREEKVIEQIRQKILDAALDIITQYGFNALTMRRLATSMNMTAPNLYNYFSNKDEIYISIVIRGFRMLQVTFEEAYRKSDDPYSRIRLIADAYVNFGLSHPLYYDIMFVSSTPKHHDYVGTPQETMSEIEYGISIEIIDLVLEAVSSIKTDITPEIARRRMIQVWSMLHGMISLHNSKIMPYVADKPDKLYAEIMDEVFETLFKKGE